MTLGLAIEDCSVEQFPLSVSVVVPTRDRNESLERCLAAISRLEPAPAEIVVVDSAPNHNGTDGIARRWHARYVLEEVLGASRARNRGAREARGDIIAYTDDDAVPDRNWLGSIVSEFRDPRVALVVGKVRPSVAQPELDTLYRIAGFTGQANARIVVDRDTPRWFETVNFLPFGIAPNLAIRRSTLREWRGFDERLGPGTPVPGHEEQRAFSQLIDLGFRLVYTPDACVTHPVPAPSAQDLRRRGLLRMQASSAYLTLLLVDEPRHRREVLTYVARKLAARGASMADNNGRISWVQQWIARLQGPCLYFKSRAACDGAAMKDHPRIA